MKPAFQEAYPLQKSESGKVFGILALLPSIGTVVVNRIGLRAAGKVRRQTTKTGLPEVFHSTVSKGTGAAYPVLWSLPRSMIPGRLCRFAEEVTL